jgi:hypothetical protein
MTDRTEQGRPEKVIQQYLFLPPLSPLVVIIIIIIVVTRGGGERTVRPPPGD